MTAMEENSGSHFGSRNMRFAQQQFRIIFWSRSSVFEPTTFENFSEQYLYRPGIRGNVSAVMTIMGNAVNFSIVATNVDRFAPSKLKPKNQSTVGVQSNNTIGTRKSDCERLQIYQQVMIAGNLLVKKCWVFLLFIPRH